MFLCSVPCVKEHIIAICSNISKKDGEFSISKKQCLWLIFCLSMMIISRSINWSLFERLSCKKFKNKALSYMFHHSRIDFEKLFTAGIERLLKIYNITKGHLIIDDTDRPRCKITKCLSFVFKNFDKKTGGYFNCQCVVFLIFVCWKITIPVGFKFYVPCPLTREWNIKDKEIRTLIKKGYVNEDGTKIRRPEKPERSTNHPKKTEIAYELLNKFKKLFPLIEIISVSFDSAYGVFESINNIEKLFPRNTLLVSELSSSVNVSDKRRSASIKDYFKSISAKEEIITIRGYKEKTATTKHARLHVHAHNRILNIVALKYEGEDDFRYLFSPNLSWRYEDIVYAYTYRWLVEVFFFDWKCYEGWGQTATQQKDAGALCGVLMSLLVDQSLLLHPEQIHRINCGMPACTVESLRNKITAEQHLSLIESIVSSENPKVAFEEYSKNIDAIYRYNDSKKHMSGRENFLEQCHPLQTKKYCL